MRADAVVKEWQRMQEDAPSVACQSVWKLRNQGLGFRAQFPAEHDDKVTLRRRLVFAASVADHSASTPILRAACASSEDVCRASTAASRLPGRM